MSEAIQDPNGFLKDCKGIMHIGANSGQERDLYSQHQLPVVWFEALPAVFEELTKNIRDCPNQIAIRALLTDCDGQSYNFRIANNGAASSSILDLKYHKDIWPEVYYFDHIELTSVSLVTAVSANNIDISRYDALIMDTQGSELLVLQGSGQLLNGFKFIKTEAADFESYENCATVASLSEFLATRGFRLIRSDKFAEHPRLGAYYDLLFERGVKQRIETGGL